jgi:formate--tetrahydrofolate ligase
MVVATDLELARGATLKPLPDIAAQLGLGERLLEPYGDGVAKIKLEAIQELADRPPARYVVVTAVTPTPLGEGKTTTTVGLGQAFAHIGRRAVVAIRQPSMGPTFGIKGGAAGGGYSQVVPMELLNLHLTGDMHAVTAAHNLLAAMIDNHIHQGNQLAIEQHDVTWRRVLDVNDRVLRNVIVGLGDRPDGVPRQSGFDITAASEVMAVLALATSLQDLRRRLGRMVIGFDRHGEPVTAEQLKAAGAMTVLLREAIKPNLLQTMENTPVLVHAGPFGNIAHGNSSVVADLIGIRGGDVLVTEAGFGADMGAERFFNIKCRASVLRPDAAVVVTTIRALKAHSGRHRIVAGKPLPAALTQENPDEVHEGAANLRKQLDNVRLHGVTPVVAVNAFPSDHPSEHAAVREIAAAAGVRAAVCTHFADGGRGAVELAEAVAAGVHRQDAPVDLLRPVAEGRPDRLGAAGAGGARLGRRRLHLPDLRRHADHAGPWAAPRRRAHRHRRARRDRRAVMSRGG